MKLNTKNLLYILAAVVVAAGLYWYFFTGSGGNAPPLSASAPAQNEAQAQFDTLVGELNPISFNPVIFSDPRFAALVDLATPIAPEATGRIDPFAPLGAKSK
ncbi:hypothetical protein HY091_00605 [Candidatus Kaiserbacteria bacterium]|nr:hypothetical protein [Candidatus Kaiserbacteria bacterium]